MRKALIVLAATLLVASAMAANLQVSFATRETDPNNALGQRTIGSNGLTAGSIEWVNLDGQTLPFDGQWHQYSFTMATDVLTPFTGDGILNGITGTIEHLRFRYANYGGFTPITLWIDDITNAYDPPGPPPPSSVTFGSFESDPNSGLPYTAGQEVMFQEPTFSGSTNAFIDPNVASASGVDDTFAHTGLASYKVNWQFQPNAGDPTADPWLRLTTFNAGPQPNPVIWYNQSSVVSFWIYAVPEPSSLLLLSVGALALLRRR